MKVNVTLPGRAISGRFARVCLFAICASCLGGAVTGAAAANPQSFPVVVNAGNKVGEFPYVLRTGVFALTFSEHASYPYEKLLTETLVGGFRNSLGLEYLPYQEDEGRFMKALDQKLEWMGRQFKAVQDKGGTPWLELGSMPRWLSVDPKFRKSDHLYWRNLPPRSLQRWSELVSYVVNYLNNRLGLKVRYSVWTEPNVNHWHASIDEFVDLYEWSVRGIRAADPNALIGAPGVLGWNKPHDLGPPGEPFLRLFLERAGKRSVNIGKRRHEGLPIDFVVFHVLLNELPEEHELIQKTVRGWLESAGYSASTPFAVGEWSLVKPARFEQGAAYAAATLVAWSRLPSFQLHTYTSIFDQTAEWSVGLFEASFDSLRVNPYVIRATYNVFRAFSRLGGHGSGDKPRMVSVDTEQAPLVYSVATYTPSSKTTRIILANFAPPNDSLGAFLRLQPERRDLGSDGGRLRGCVAKVRERDLKGAMDCLSAQVNGIKDPAKREQMQRALQRIKRDINLIRNRQKESVTVSLRVDNLGFSGPGEVIHYRIDGTHSNSARLLSTPRGQALQQDLRAARVAAEEKALDASASHLLAAGYSSSNVAAVQKRVFEPYLKRTATTDARFLTPDKAKSAVAAQVEEAVGGRAQAQRVTADVLETIQQVLIPVYRDLYYRGRASTPSGERISIPLWVEKVNGNAGVSLESSAEKQRVTVAGNRSLAAPIVLEPYSVHYFEISPAR